MTEELNEYPSADEQALAYIINWLKTKIIIKPNNQGLEPYGFDLYRDLLKDKLKIEPIDPHNPKTIEEKIPLLNAIWDLCTRGILRPGATTFGWNYSSTSDMKIPIGSYFALTNYGVKWLNQENPDDVLPLEYKRFSKLLSTYNSKFGKPFSLRAQEAVGCYEAHRYYACCAMCGAAAESVLLAPALIKIGEQEALSIYQRSGGRGRIRNALIGKAKGDIQGNFDACLTLINYWRDESAHGTARGIGENEAFTSLLLLLRFARLVNDEWDVIIHGD